LNSSSHTTFRRNKTPAAALLSSIPRTTELCGKQGNEELEMNKTIRNEKRVTRNGFREPARRTKKQSLVLGDVPNVWANQLIMSWRNDIDGKQWVEELKTAIANLREQGCGDPNFIYAPGFLVVTRKQIREGLEVLDGSRKVKRELLNSLKWGMTGEV